MKKKKGDGGGRGRKAEQKEDTELCTSQAFVDCSTRYTMLLQLNKIYFWGEGYALFLIKLRGAISFVQFNERGSKVLFGIDDESYQPYPSISNEWSL